MLKYLAFDAIVAWHVFDLQRCAKLEPDKLATQVVEPEAIKVCQILLHDKNPDIPVRAPTDLTIRDHVICVTRLAGFRPTKRQPVPGLKLLWLGTSKLLRGFRVL